MIIYVPVCMLYVCTSMCVFAGVGVVSSMSDRCSCDLIGGGGRVSEGMEVTATCTHLSVLIIYILFE